VDSIVSCFCDNRFIGMYKIFRGKEIFYFKGSTPPLKMDFKNKKIKDNTKINSENLKAIMETELIAKLFKKTLLVLTLYLSL